MASTSTVRQRAVGVVAALALVTGMLAVGGVAGADGHLETVAEGLDNPRGIALGPGGRILVAEAGRGGSTAVEVSIGDEADAVCVGMTGAVTEIGRRGQRTLVELPSYGSADESGACTEESGFGAIGPHDVALGGRGELSVVIGLGGTPEARDQVAAAFPAGALFGTAHRILPNGNNKPLGDLAMFEADNDSDGEVDSNAYGVAIDRGSRLVADAGGNSLVRLAANGAASLVATFAPQCVDWTAPFPNPIPPEFNPCGSQALFPAQAVPTAVAVGPDGDYYVSELGGFPFTVGASRVWRIDADHVGPASCSTFAFIPNDGCEVHAGGLTSVVDIAFGPGGELYAVQIADAGVLAAETGGPLDGSVQVIPGGGGTPVASIGGLTAPGGVAVGDGDLYITDFSIFPGAGRVVRTARP
jgi:hypothetical protein